MLCVSAGDGQALVGALQATSGNEVPKNKCREEPVSYREIEDLHVTYSCIGEERQSGGLCGIIS